ncbi:MAG: LPS export ABC transporter ATP-binding protein [Candidatus Sericytochromatia bacterium]|uniref:LPS export ABC transporter ATP-binding protein n=1 Tax=Candidatus Tanganyikabacteria bacterium TaxID=2961651 RepID=A0A937X5B7_9BACT|nr:LPS export ABC transporter ATP-binding protein [Candidatus Tanganyikabacteria bacterium]
MIKTDALVKIYRGRKVVNEVSISVNKGEIVGLLGPNGAGKTTTFYMVVGLVRPYAGSVMLNGENIAHLPMHLRARKGIGYLAQEPSVFRKLSVEQNLLAVWELLGIPKKVQKERLESLLDEFHIQKIRKSKGFQLSGGERRRVEIARALATNPQFILLDEPFSGIDPLAIADIQKMLRHLRGRDLGLLITDHNVRDTLKIVDRAYIIDSGTILFHGSPDEIVSSDIARKHYLGEEFGL